MRYRIVLPVALVFAATAAEAGPNAGGVLLLHANTSITYTSESTDYCGQAGLAACSLAVTSVPWDPETTTVFYVLAAFADTAAPRLKALSFGIDWDPENLSIVAHGSCADFDLPDNAWPDPGTGIGLSWTSARTDSLVDAYWFAAHAYAAGDGPDTTSVALSPHPVQGAVMVDDAVPPNEDEIAAFGRLGFGTVGGGPCPGEVDSGGDSGGGGEEPEDPGDEEPEEPGDESPPVDTENCAPNVVLIRFAPNEISFPQENPSLHANFELPLSAAEFTRSSLEDALDDLGVLSLATVAPQWRHMTEEDMVDVHGRRVELVDFTDVYRAELDGSTSLGEAVAALMSLAGVEHASCDRIGAWCTVDSLYAQQWYLNNTGQVSGCPSGIDVDAPEAWALQDSAGTKIGVFDSAINRWVPGLDGYVDTRLSHAFIGDSCWTTGIAHGTRVASIAATGTLDSYPLASICNLPNSHDDSLIVSLRTDAYVDPTIAALSYVSADPVRAQLRVANHSWGYPTCKSVYGYSPYLRDAFRNAFLCGINLICAAGNECQISCEPDTCWSWPAAFTDYCLAVSAVDCSGAPEYSYHHGSYVDLAAPGKRIYYLEPDGPVLNEGIYTSYATPLVSGTIALMLGADPNLTNEDCYNILKLTARPLSLPSIWVGSGMLNAGEALAHVTGSRYVKHDSTNTLTAIELDGDPLRPAWFRNVNMAGEPREGPFRPYLVDRYRLAWHATLDVPDSHWVEHVWARGKTSSGWRKIDASIGDHYDAFFYVPHAETDWRWGNAADFYSYVYKVYSLDEDSLGWAPFNPYQLPASAQVTYSSVVHRGTTARVVSRDDQVDGFRVRAGHERVIFDVGGRIAAPFTIGVYDAGGRQVRRIQVDGSSRVQQEVDWDLRDSSSRRVPSGLYFARLQFEDPRGCWQARTARVLVVR